MEDQTATIRQARARLERWPRIDLGQYPTPLERLTRLSASLGASEGVYVKRDDSSGLGLGGNKIRKLEFLLGEARAEGADVVLTTGALQSNHARQTAAAAAKLGLRCELVLPRMVRRSGPAYEQGGNRLLDDLFGAEVFETDDVAEAARTIAARVDHAEKEGLKLYAMPPGGSSTVGCLGFVSGAIELYEQAHAAEIEIARIYVAVSTGGSLAGLLAGLALLGWAVPVTGVCVYQDQAATEAEVYRLLGELGGVLELGAVEVPPFELRDAFIGEGYGLPTPEGIDAIRECASQEGLLLDPVYTGKAMAALLGDFRTRGAPSSGATVFWHTGGVPAIFAYAEELSGPRS